MYIHNIRNLYNCDKLHHENIHAKLTENTHAKLTEPLNTEGNVL